jgi:hypothetical protein
MAYFDKKNTKIPVNFSISIDHQNPGSGSGLVFSIKPGIQIQIGIQHKMLDP